MAETPGTPGSVDGSPAILPADAPPTKKKTRPRLLRGIQRMASSPSLSHLGRPRSSSAPYNPKASFSCVSLASDATPNSSVSYASTSASSASSSSPRSALGTPLSEVPSCDALDNALAPRMLGRIRATSSATTATLPPDLVSSRQDLSGTRQRSGTQMRSKKTFNFWADMPSELRVHVFSFLEPKELVRVSTVSRLFHKTSFDGQLWANLDASEFYREIPAESLSKIILATAPFIKNLNLRGCVQISQKRAHMLVNACGNLVNATLEGCRNLPRAAIHALLSNNENLRYLNVTGLTAVSNSTCELMAESCKQLETLKVSWCKNVDSRGIQAVVEGCPLLKDLRAGDIKGFDDLSVAETLFKTNNLERLVLSGCADLTDEALQTMMHGADPEIDILTDLPIAPSRRLRHLDLSRCPDLTTEGVEVIGSFVPDLEGFQISGCPSLTDAAIEPIFANAPKLTHIEMEDLHEVTNSLFSDHLANAPCITGLEHLSISYCMGVGDAGILPVIRKATALKSVDLNNTRVTDLALAAAASTVGARSPATPDGTVAPKRGLHMVVYDCENVTWTGIREVLFRNAQVKFVDGEPAYPSEIIGLKCFYGYQMTVDEHEKRVLRCDLAAAGRLERKWADYMQANEEAGAGGAGIRRRRRRAREAQMLHADEEEGLGHGRRRARSAPSCTVM